MITPEEFAKSLKLDKLQLDLLAIPLMKLLKLDRINQIYKDYANLSGLEFIDVILKEALNIRYEVSSDELNNIPRKGPFIIIANHPYGGVDGLLLLSIIARIRPDFKVLANYLLQHIPNIKDYFISVNPFDGADKQMNVAGIKSVLDQLSKGNAIGIFPAGEVSSFQSESRKIIDKEWSIHVAKIVRKAKVPVIPVYFAGYNSVLFNLLGMIHPTLRTARLPSEMLNKGEDVIKIRIGKPINPAHLEDYSDPITTMRYLRARTYALSSFMEEKTFFKNPFKIKKKPQEIISATPVEDIENDIKNLHPQSLMIKHNNFEVYLSDAISVPHVLREIGRLREICFRQEGEGTNREIDLDEYDIHYNHLFMWDADARRLVGAYRIGKGGELYSRFKVKGFYLNELFKMNKDFVPYLKQSLEMGRAFVVEEYQRKPVSLFLLWKGVLAYVRRNPEYKYLIGAVSISSSFSLLSRELLVKFVREHYFDEELAAMVKPRNRFKPRFDEDESQLLLKNNSLDIKGLDLLISEIEPTHTKIPVLLKKYLSQNAKIIGFNIDPKFNNSLDGFVIMNMETVPEDTFKMLDKFS